MRPRWRKVLHDLWDSKLRTLLVVFSIAVGVFSIGVISGAYVIIANDMSASYAMNNPSNVEFRMVNFDDDVLASIENSHDVKEAEARRVFNIRVRVAGTEKWTTLDMVAFDDFEDNAINLLLPVEGKSVPDKREVILERDALNDLNVDMGGMLEFQLPDGSIKTMPVVGVVQDTAMGAGDFLAAPYAYITMSSLQYLRQPELFNRAYITTATGGDDIFHIRTVGADLKDKLDKSGSTVIRLRFAETHKHPLASTVNAILGILLMLGVLILFLSSSLIANTLSALLNQHLRHIGVIKLVGGQRRQVFVMYITLIMSFAALALMIAVPLGGQGAYELAVFVADKLNFSILEYRIVPMALVIQIVVGLLVPLIAGLAPVLNGSNITVLRALSNDLTGDESKPVSGQQERINWFDWMLIRLTRFFAARGVHFPRPFIISLRNTFRRRGRLVLTLFTLTMGGAIFIAVFNVRTTLHEYIGAIGRYFAADVSVDFDSPYRLSEMEQAVMSVDGVLDVEGWQFLSGEVLDSDGLVLENINIFGPPADSQLIEPLIVAGRWIEANDVRKLTLSESAYRYFPGLQPGDYITLKIDGREEAWEVVGIFKFVDREGMLGYAPFNYVAELNNLANRSYSFRLVTAEHNRAYQDAKAEELDKYLREQGFKVRVAEAGSASLDVAVESLDILVVFLLIMAVLTAIVGAMGLTGTMGMNVLERTREIGIMRAIGADDRAVMRTVIGEGFVIGIVSFLIAIVVSIPITYGLSYIVSLAVFETPIDVVFTLTGYAIWLGLVLLLSVLGSILPARNAARLTIREVLAYE